MSIQPAHEYKGLQYYTFLRAAYTRQILLDGELVTASQIRVVEARGDGMPPGERIIDRDAIALHKHPGAFGRVRQCPDRQEHGCVVMFP